MRAHVVDVDALERQLKDAEILCSPGTPLEYKQATYGFGIAWECISALRQQQEALKEKAKELARLREAIEKATEVRFPKSQRDYHNNVWKPLRKALEPTKGSE